MSFFTRWFRKAESENYEEILAGLATDIHKRQTRLAEIRLRERRATLTVTLWSTALYVLYVAIWWMGLLPHWGRQLALFMPRTIKSRPSTEGGEVRYGQRVNQWESVFEAAWLVVGPIGILFIRRVMQIWYKRIGDAEEETLKRLLKQQRIKVEEIKKKTNYYSTRNLLEKYDETPTATPRGGLLSIPGTALRPQQPQPQQQHPLNQSMNPAMRGRVGVPMTPQNPNQNRAVNPMMQTGLRNQLQTQPQTPLPPARKQWYDKVADALLGDDEAGAGSSTSRYALICSKCFSHNGLVKESVWEETQYMCPKCGHFNESAKAKRGRPSPSPQRSPAETQRGNQMNHNSNAPLSPEGLSQRVPSAKGRKEASSGEDMEVDS